MGECAVVATTALAHRNLARVEGFRRDLWLRFSVYPVCLAPLSERRADVPLLADAIVSAIAERLRIRPPALADGATDVRGQAALTGNLTGLEATLAPAIVSVVPGQPLTAQSLTEAYRALAYADHPDQPRGGLDVWLGQALSEGTPDMTVLETQIHRTAVARVG